jgi:hypothetical protein
MRQQGTTKWMIAIALALPIPSFADGGIISYVNPGVYQFNLYAENNRLTQCNQIEKLLAKYKALQCDSDGSNFQCPSLVTSIQAEGRIDLDGDALNPIFSKSYLIQNMGSVSKPAGKISKRFDVSYADTYDFIPEQNSSLEFYGSLSAAELDAEVKANLPTHFKLFLAGGRHILQTESKIRACALEKGRISVRGKGRVNVSGFHPMGRIAFEIVNEAYAFALDIAQKKDLSVSQQNYLLGLKSGALLKKAADQITDESDLLDLSLSLQKVLTDISQPGFKPRPVTDSSSLVANELIEPGFTESNAAIQINFAQEQ